MLRINDLFWTIQGEGKFAGYRSLFVRLPYCNYKCPWCDTSFNSYKEVEGHEFTQFMEQEKARHAVLTGGEPLMNSQAEDIVWRLKKAGFYVSVETNGSCGPVQGVDFYTCSPKKYVQKGLPEYFINPALFDHVGEFKYVVDSNFDFSVLDRHNTIENKARLSLSPEFNEFEKNIEKIIAYIKENPQWVISLQGHKWMKIP